MTNFLYTIFLQLFRIAILVASLWDKKAQLWIKGRKKLLSRLQNDLSDNHSKIAWMHCSSLGEFEQGRPILESLKQHDRKIKILLTFFSSSGFEVRKNYSGADWIFYLPMDSPSNAKIFLDTANPSLVIFVKYEYWFYYLTECKKRKIPLLLVSGIFRSTLPFFKWYGSFHRKMLDCFTHFFVQDENSINLLHSIQLNNCTVSGDTRFDRVITIKENFTPFPAIEKFISNSKVLIAGSTWQKDENIISEAFESSPHRLKLIIAPHEIHQNRLQEIKNNFPNSVLLSEFSTINSTDKVYDCLIIDSIGILANLYHYSTIAYIGGGFNNGIHNTLESAVHGKPILFGPKFEKFNEANFLIKEKSAFCITNATSLKKQIDILLNDAVVYENCCLKSKEYVQKQKGATQIITAYIQENLLLTNP